MNKREKHTKTFDDWIAQGNRLLKIGDTIFLIIDIDKDTNYVLTYVCGNTGTHSGWLPKWLFGEMIDTTKKRDLIPFESDCMALHDFAKDLILYDTLHSIDKTVLFSFDQIDMRQLPGRVLEELMIQKLSK